LNTKLKCLLLDDELPGLTYLKMMCEQIPEVEVVRAFDNPSTFLKEVNNLEFDFCILDIEMPALSGLDVAQRLQGKPVIFTTAYKEYAAEAFNIDAIDYVQKPVKIERLHQAIGKIRKHFSVNATEKRFVQLNADKGKALVPFDQLLYVKASDIDSRDKLAYLSDGSQFTLKNISFDSLQKLLPANDFVRINKQEIIAVKIVSHFSHNEITRAANARWTLPAKFSLSEVYRNEFIRRIEI
jgi:DNA-binding LytR/AlgR family response regulator